MVTFNAMPKTNTKKRTATARGNAIENERREAQWRDDESLENGVTEEQSKLAEEYPDGGESGGKKY